MGDSVEKLFQETESSRRRVMTDEGEAQPIFICVGGRMVFEVFV